VLGESDEIDDSGKIFIEGNVNLTLKLLSACYIQHGATVSNGLYFAQFG